MAKKGKTDNEIFGEELPTRIKTKGRPRVNDDLIRLLIESGKYTTKQIAKRADCHEESVRRVRRRLEKEGVIDLEKDLRTDNFVEAEFDAECLNAMGISFKDWLTSKRKSGMRVFNFCRKTWSSVWEKPSLVRVRDTNDNLGQQLCIDFLNTFKDDEKRSRDRKKLIRQLFIFLGRHDLCDQHLTMSQRRDPRRIKKIPEINSAMFPLKLEQAIYEMGLIDPLYPLMIKFKLVTGCRTGNKKDERGLLGIHKGSAKKSFAYIDDEGNYQISIFEKMGEQWEVTWLGGITEELTAHYKTIERDEPLFKVSGPKLLKAWGDITEKYIDVRLDLHALRKVFLTWLWVLDVRLEIATKINVGWKDLSTADRHYFMIGAQLRKKSIREEYIKNIPEWFKEDLDEYVHGDVYEKIAQLMKGLN